MPASTSDPISSTLKRSFCGGPKGSSCSLEEGLASALSKRSLLPVAFDPPSRVSSPGPLKHYIILNSVSGAQSGSHGSHGNHGNSQDKTEKNQGSTSGSPSVAIPRPKVTFFRQEDVHVGYRSQLPPGAGMMNVGNTCYLNSTLQALFHTPALINYLSNGHHRCLNGPASGGYSSHGCTICALSLTLKDTLRSHVVRPSRVYEKLKTICKHLVHGRQEDAHEFLRYLIESLQKSFLTSVKAYNMDTPSKETTPFNQIFGGYMRQDVTCVRCKYVSTTFQHFMDLLLDIRSASNIDEALAHYFRPEKLGGNDGSNMYKCEKCKVKVPAQKSCLIERPPVVLCVQLKRFALTGGKISKSVQLNRKLEVSRFVRGGKSSSKLEYRLVSMITHVGPSPNCGHYTAIGEASNGQFYQFDDSHVRPVPVSQALNTASYVVMYEMTASSHVSWTKSNPPKSQPSPAKPEPKPATLTLPTKNNTLNGTAAIKPPPVLPKKLVPYDELDTSSSEEDDKSPQPKPPANGVAKPPLKCPNGDSSKSPSNDPSKKPLGFLPVSIALKQQHQALPEEKRRPSASGTWTVVDMDHHNPSIHSDNSSGSGSQWKIHSVQEKTSEGDSSSSRSISTWSVKNTLSNGMSSAPNGENGEKHGGSPKKMKKMNAVKEAISNTIGRFFTTNKPKSNGVISEEDGGNKTLNGVPSSNGSLKPSDEEPRLGAQEEEEDDGLKKRKKSFSSSNGELEGSPLKKVPSESRWNSNGGVVDELMRQSSLAEKVTSWNGGKSITFSSSSSSYNSRREDADDRDGYDDELDRGRKRKIKRRHSDSAPYSCGPNNNNNTTNASGGGSNPFQLAQNGFQSNGNNHHNHNYSRKSSFKDYNGRHSRRPYYHRNNLRNSHGGSFDDGKFRKGYRSSNNDNYNRFRR